MFLTILWILKAMGQCRFRNFSCKKNVCPKPNIVDTSNIECALHAQYMAHCYDNKVPGLSVMPIYIEFVSLYTIKTGVLLTRAAAVTLTFN